MVEHLQSLDFIPLGENVVIVGDPGTGKTHLAQAIGNACCDRLVPARYYKLPELVDKLRRSMDRETEGQTILHLVSVPCLIIDEVGYCGKLGEKESDLFFQLLDRRYDHAGCSTVFTSNRMPSEWRELFHDALTAKSTLDRIMDRCIAIELRGASYRGQQRKVFKVNCSPLPVVSGLRP